MTVDLTPDQWAFLWGGITIGWTLHMAFDYAWALWISPRFRAWWLRKVLPQEMLKVKGHLAGDHWIGTPETGVRECDGRENAIEIAGWTTQGLIREASRPRV